MNDAQARRAVVEKMTALQTSNEAGTVVVKKIEYGLNGAVTRGNVARFARRTWCGVPGYSWEVRERGAHGRRSLYTWWLGKAIHQETDWEPGTLVVTTVKGNWHGGTFERLTDPHEIKIEGLALS